MTPSTDLSKKVLRKLNLLGSTILATLARYASDLTTTMPSTADARKNSIRKLNLAGFTTIAILVGGVGGWAATMQLSGAVIAAGMLVVESNVKKVQHPTGGVVGEILVKEGSVVENGEIVLRLDDTIPRASLAIVRSQLDELLSRQGRLVAERDGAEAITFPEELVRRIHEPSVAASTASEIKLFESRRQVRTGQRNQLRERIGQIEEEITGLASQRDAKESELRLISEELKGVESLYKKNLVSIMRYMQLQRDQAKLQGDRGQFIADIARARARISESELQIIQLEQEFRNEVLKELREIDGRTAELREKFNAAEDQLKRVDLRAPQAGIVHQLNVHTVGGVITNAETIMLIVPQTDELIVEAKVSPTDIDQISLGATVMARIMAGNHRTTPDVSGVVTRVSADLTREASTATSSGAAYYLVRIELSADSVRGLAGLKLIPGMPVEAFIRTESRTALDYLIKPLQEQIARTFRER
jgi:HlyD family secretion protein